LSPCLFVSGLDSYAALKVGKEEVQGRGRGREGRGPLKMHIFISECPSFPSPTLSPLLPSLPLPVNPSFQVMEMMSKFCAEGRLIVCTIHQVRRKGEREEGGEGGRKSRKGKLNLV